jgi:glutamate N-acetyltransferase/amino-acid N-acetyltransferase
MAQTGPVSPLAPARFPDLPEIKGLSLQVGEAGLYKRPRTDLALFGFEKTARAAGVFTTNAVGSAPTDWSKAALKQARGAMRGLLVNAGCANSFTGKAGDQACQRSMASAARLIGCAPEQMLAASTGVIGVVLDEAKVSAALSQGLGRMKTTDWRGVAEAIMTTDTFPKGAGAQVKIGPDTVSIAGIAKGSGMIAPNMATMLAFVFTDATLPATVLKRLLKDAAETSFNAITVDGDRSTNDCVMLVATGHVVMDKVRSADDPSLKGFKKALNEVLADLAIQIVRDGEGARKLVKVTVTGAASAASAKIIARTVCESPLVKTAIAGEDANWGRIVAAAGRADQPINRDLLSVKFGPLWAARRGMVAKDYSEADMSAYMKGDSLEITVDVGVGKGSAVMHTCDLTKRYIEINGDYRS